MLEKSHKKFRDQSDKLHLLHCFTMQIIPGCILNNTVCDQNAVRFIKGALCNSGEEILIRMERSSLFS